MSLSKFSNLSGLSNEEISQSIIETENQLFKLHFKKATRQNIKSHEIKNLKRRLAQLKTLFTQKLKDP